MIRIATGITAVVAGALTGFDGLSGGFLALAGSGLVLSGVDRTIPDRVLVVQHPRRDP